MSSNGIEQCSAYTHCRKVITYNNSENLVTFEGMVPAIWKSKI